MYCHCYDVTLVVHLSVAMATHQTGNTVRKYVADTEGEKKQADSHPPYQHDSVCVVLGYRTFMH